MVGSVFGTEQGGDQLRTRDREGVEMKADGGWIPFQFLQKENELSPTY
jgi:hypothetical protein